MATPVMMPNVGISVESCILTEWHKKSNLPLKKFFNTSGLLYKSLDLKNRIPTMTEEEMLELLASDGMLVKRPLLVGKDFVLVGFKESEWSDVLAKEDEQ